MWSSIRSPGHSLTRTCLAVAAMLATSAAASAQGFITWHAVATEAEEVPPTGSPGTADATLTLDTRTNVLSWSVSHQGLTGAPTLAHFHGPAGIGMNAGVQVNIGVASNPIVGSAPLTGGQVTDLMNGLWYLNIHTDAFPGGEIRGQIDDVLVETHCVSVANSFDPTGARLTTPGDFEAANNALTFDASGVPPGQFGYLLVGQGTGQTMPPGSSGVLCLIGGQIGRYNQQVLTADGGGNMGTFTPDILNLPNPPGGSIAAGETWGFQVWFRDGMTNNFTDALSITFQ